MNQKQVIDTALKILGIFFGGIAIRYIAEVFNYFNLNFVIDNVITELLSSSLIYVAFFSILCWILIFKTTIVLNKIYPATINESHSADSSKPISSKDIVILSLKILGLVYLTIACNRIIVNSYLKLYLFYFPDFFYALKVLLGILINNSIEITFGIILVRTPNWLLKTMRYKV